MSKTKMICEKCGAEMNHHSEKIDYAAALKNPSKIDPHFDGVVLEFHTCPECGATASRETQM